MMQFCFKLNMYSVFTQIKYIPLDAGFSRDVADGEYNRREPRNCDVYHVVTRAEMKSETQ